jgi:dynein heavy chain, axonemal
MKNLTERVSKLNNLKTDDQNDDDNNDCENIFRKFVERSREHLHIILAFSPIGDKFRERIRIYPTLINYCIIDWFEEWPIDALELVADYFLEDIEFEDDIRAKSIIMCKDLHQDAISLSEKFKILCLTKTKKKKKEI